MKEVSRSEMVRRRIRLLAEERMKRGETSPFEAIKHLVGDYGGPGNLAENIGGKLHELLKRRR